jgi:hypothetical protein
MHGENRTHNTKPTNFWIAKVDETGECTGLGVYDSELRGWIMHAMCALGCAVQLAWD